MTDEINEEFFKSKGQKKEKNTDIELNDYENKVLQRLKRIMQTDPESPILKKEVEILKKKAGVAN